MHDHHMRFLAEDRRRELLAEADRARLARAARQRAPTRPTRSRRTPHRVSLGVLLARMAARVG